MAKKIFKLMSLLIIAILFLIIINGNYINSKNKTNILVGEIAGETVTMINKKPMYNNPVIPVGFKAVNTEDASWIIEKNYIKDWNEGLVIEDEGCNQFVWVPVDGLRVRYEKWNTLNIKYNDENLKDARLPLGVIYEETQINKYGGFYVGRYTTGIPDIILEELNIEYLEKKKNKIEVPIVQKSATIWTYITHTNAKASAEMMYVTEYVRSGLITGTAWDTIMRWFDNSNINVLSDSTDWGNYKNSSVTGITSYSVDHGKTWIQQDGGEKGVGEIWQLKTGDTDYTKKKNIYDMAGGSWEWTNEIYCNELGVIRGGSYGTEGNKNTPAYRHAFRADDPTGRATASRIILYIK